jgi:phosphoglycolate phosphatase
MSFRAVIFDLDGTLLDTLQDLADAMNAVLERNRLPAHRPKAYRHFVGDGIEMLVRRALPFTLTDESELDRFAEEMRREYARRWIAKTRPYPGVPELLAAIGAAGLVTAVLTNKPQAAAEAILAALLPGQGFRCVVGGAPGRPRKPDPSGALAIARELGLPPASCLLVGDSAVDIQAARAAGMVPVGALWGFRTAEELVAAGAQILVTDPSGLIPWF